VKKYLRYRFGRVFDCDEILLVELRNRQEPYGVFIKTFPTPDAHLPSPGEG
jgi:hypothetical protein